MINTLFKQSLSSELKAYLPAQTSLPSTAFIIMSFLIYFIYIFLYFMSLPKQTEVIILLLTLKKNFTFCHHLHTLTFEEPLRYHKGFIKQIHMNQTV